MTLGGINLNTFGFIAGKQAKSNISLIGHCDMPARIGKTFQSWAESKSVEPYVEADEIFFSGRDIQLIGFVKGVNKNDTEAKNRGIINLVDSFTTLTPFISKWGNYSVKIENIETTYLGRNIFKCLVNMREPVVAMSDIIPNEDNAIYGIDKISFKALGGELLKVTGDIRNRPKTKEQYFTAYQKEGYQITKTDAPILEIQLFIKGSDYSDFKNKINGLQTLLKKPGTRLINIPNNTLREFFVTDGFKVTNMYSNTNHFFGFVTIKAIEVFDFDFPFGRITDNYGNYITDNYNNKIYGRY